MRVAQDFAGEVTFALQFRLISVQPGHIQHEAANLHQPAKTVIHAEGVDENVDGRAVLAAKRGFKIPHVPVFFHGLAVEQALLGSEIDLGSGISTCSKFFAAGVTQHGHQGVIDFDETAFRRAEEKSFLNVVEQFAIAALCLAAVGDVLQDMDGLQIFTGGAVNSGSGNQISPVERGMDDIRRRARPWTGKTGTNKASIRW